MFLLVQPFFDTVGSDGFLHSSVLKLIFFTFLHIKLLHPSYNFKGILSGKLNNQKKRLKEWVLAALSCLGLSVHRNISAERVTVNIGFPLTKNLCTGHLSGANSHKTQTPIGQLC
jgi:hypothetical protein